MTFGELFLTQSDLFPARPAGEPWGPGRLELDLAGGPVLVDGLAGGQARLLEERFGERVTRPGDRGGEDHAVRLRVLRAAVDDFRTFDRQGWTATLDRSYEPGAVRLAGWRFMARLDWRPELTATLWTPLQDHADLQGAFENLLRVLVAYRVLEADGVVVHSSAVVVGEGVFLFFGRSGAGKSTLAGHARAAGREILSDDLNALLPGSDETFQVERLPFAGDLGQTAEIGASAGAPAGSSCRRSWPARGLLRLVQAPAVSVAPVSRGRALASLLTCCPFVNADPHRRARLEETLDRLLEAIPVAALEVGREVDFSTVAAALDGWRGEAG